MKEIRERFSNAQTGWSDNHDMAREDIKFLDGDQWKVNDRVTRGDRPAITINRLPSLVDLVMGGIKQNKLSIKVRPVDGLADTITARVFEGLIRNIEKISKADVAYETAVGQAIGSGFGFYRVVTEYADDESFDQDIKIKRIINPFTVLFDPSAQEFDFSDAKYCFIDELIPNAEFKRKYPKATLESFSTTQYSQWIFQDEVRIADYYSFEHSGTTKLVELAQTDPIESDVGTIMLDGRVTKMEDIPDEIKNLIENGVIKIRRERKIDEYKVVQQKINGHEILEESDWAGNFIPVIPVIGKELNVDGKQKYRGIVRFAKDPQRMLNYSKSNIAEILGLQPKVPFIAEWSTIKRHLKYWNNANVRSYPFLPYDAKDSSGQVINAGRPERPNPMEPSAALFQQEASAIDDLKGVTGIFDASRGARSNETSGKAIEARTVQGDFVNFDYRDNLRRSLITLGMILVDLIPKIYDAPRIVTILGEDEKPDVIKLLEDGVIMKNIGDKGEDVVGKVDLSIGKYDVEVSVGPSMGTKREEQASNMTKFAQLVPDLAPIILTQVAKVSDWPGAEQIRQAIEQLQQTQNQQNQDPNPQPIPQGGQ